MILEGKIKISFAVRWRLERAVRGASKGLVIFYFLLWVLVT